MEHLWRGDLPPGRFEGSREFGAAEVDVASAQDAHANLRRNATGRGLHDAKAKFVRARIRYVRGARHYLAYDQARAAGLRIATGVIEGACRI